MEEGAMAGGRMQKNLANGARRSAGRLPLGRALAVAALLALAAGGTGAGAQICTPATKPCQVCTPPPCVPSAQSCSQGPANLTLEAAVTCTGPTAQTTVTVQTIIGPAPICYGAQKALSCTIPQGGEVTLTEVDTITPAAVLVPTLSLWSLGALAVLLGALALRRLAAGAPAAARQP
jgi:IPTL-CTERM motif